MRMRCAVIHGWKEGVCMRERIGKSSMGTMGKSKQCKEEASRGTFVYRNVFP